MASLTRRDFLTATGAGLVLSLNHLQWIAPAQAWAAGRAPKGQSYRAWEDFFRKEWQWDRVARSTHFLNCAYQASCNWNIYVKHGMVWREEQAAIYPQTIPGVPDMNPRGCQKGACFSDRMYDPTRVRYPLKRVGKRGEGKWQRVSWDQALTEIADEFINTLGKEGPAAINWDVGTNFSFGPQGLGMMRNTYLLDAVVLDMDPEIGDHHPGAAVTTGKIMFCSNSEDMFHASILIIWGANPFYTQIPNAHYLTEARYHGTKIVSICPDYSPSTIHADLWVPVKIGTDPALALAMSQVIVSEKLHNVAFLKEQTDMPLLVREDTRLLLRESDLKAGGAEDLFYAWDNASGSVRPMPRDTLKLGAIDPALEGDYEVETLKGKVKVRPVFEALKQWLEEYTPEKASRICGTKPDLIRRLAREIAQAKAVTTHTTYNFSKFYNGMDTERAQILVLALCGHIGRKGAGHQAFAVIVPDGFQEILAYPSMPLPAGKEVWDRERAPWVKALKEKGYTDEMISYEENRRLFENKSLLSSVLMLYYHGGVKELMADQRKWDSSMKRDLDEYLKLSLSKNWQFAYPDIPPRILVAEGGNLLRRFRGYPKLIEGLLPKLRLLLVLDWRLSNTARYADYVLPVAGWYEREDVRFVGSPAAPFLHAAERVIDPVGESHSQWKIHCLLAKKIQERAVQRGLTRFKDREGKERRLDNLYRELTYGGNYRENDDAKLSTDFVKVCGNLQGATWDDFVRDGFVHMSSMGTCQLNIGNGTDLKPNEPLTPNTWYVQEKIPWPTLTRRMQFYIDHELYLELGHEFPVYQENHIGGNYPLRITGGHTRHSIHTAWRDHALMLRLQRGEPVMYINTTDASARKIADHELVRVYNDVGAFEIRAKVSPSCAPGQVIVYHAWEPYMFKNGYSHQTLLPSPINPLELAGQYFHLRPMLFTLSPGQNDRGTRVEVEKVRPGGGPIGLRI